MLYRPHPNFMRANVFTEEKMNFYVMDFFSKCKQFPRMYRSSHQRCSVRKGVLRNLAKFAGKHLSQSLFFSKVAGLGLQLY